MPRIVKLHKSKFYIIACIIFVSGCLLLNSTPVKARRHLGLKSLQGINNIQYECDNSDKEFPAFYIQFDYTDEAPLQKIIDQLSLEESEFLFYAGSYPPVWWPDEIKDWRGDPEGCQKFGRALRESGDLITYRNISNEITKGPSANKGCIIELFHYPKKKQIYYVKRWVGVYTP